MRILARTKGVLWLSKEGESCGECCGFAPYTESLFQIEFPFFLSDIYMRFQTPDAQVSEEFEKEINAGLDIYHSVKEVVELRRELVEVALARCGNVVAGHTPFFRRTFTPISFRFCF